MFIFYLAAARLWPKTWPGALLEANIYKMAAVAPTPMKRKENLRVKYWAQKTRRLLPQTG